MYRLIVACVLSVLITGCGFQLRGQTTHALAIHQLQLSPAQPESATYQSILQYLKNQGLSVNADEQAPTLSILSQGIKDHVLAYGPQGQVRRERLTYHFTFEVTDTMGEVIVPRTTLKTDRDRVLNPDQSLADDHERQLLEREMRYDILGQMMQLLVL